MDASDFTTNERRILTFTAVGHFLCHFYMLVFPAVLLLILGDLELDIERGMRLSFVSYLLFGLGALPAGLLSTRVPIRLLLVVFLLGSGLFSAATGLWGTSASIPWLLGGMGLCCSIYHPGAMALISNGIRQRGRAHGIHGVFGSLGIAISPLLAVVFA